MDLQSVLFSLLEHDNWLVTFNFNWPVHFGGSDGKSAWQEHRGSSVLIGKEWFMPIDAEMQHVSF